ncbi:high-affinity glucose transporter [Trichoderma asperellum]|uniref:High-affinity glucose transporter n=1 Tax=Trichoderma asperellum TaxID=101201 RepID=A0A6V8R059_TRIAP|nr:high-affinity glucose transporter [Trichoderma asperellum]
MYRIWNIYVLAAFGTIGGMIFGFEISSMSAWIGSDQYLEYFNHPGSAEQGGITASMSAGSFVGSLLSGWLADRLGRRLAIQIASVDWIIGAVLQCSSQNVAHLVVGRIVSGLAIGITSSQCIVYLSELAPSRIRGRVVGIQQWSIDWGDRGNVVVLAELEEVREAARIAAESKEIGYLGLFAPKMWKRTLVGVSAQVWQQLLGGNVMLYYLVYIFNMAGMSGNAALTSSIIQYVIFLVTTGGVLFVIDRMGRRWLLIVGAIICGIIHFTVGAVMAVYGHHVDNVDGIDILKWQISGPPAKAVIALCYIFVGIWVTWAPGAWIYCGEVFPLKYRAKGVGLAAAGNWAFNLALAFFVPPAFTNIQWKAYMIFGTFCIAMVFHVYFMYPETVKKSLEEIDVLFDDNIPAWRSASAVSTFEEKVVRVKETGGLEELKQQGDVDHAEKV